MSKQLLQDAEVFLNAKMSHMSTSDKVAASREAKRLILGINEDFKKTKDPALMEKMKELTVKKKKIEKRLGGLPTDLG